VDALVALKRWGALFWTSTLKIILIKAAGHFMRLRIAIQHLSTTLVMGEFVSGPSRYHLAIKGICEKFVVFRTEFRTLQWGFNDLYHWTREITLWGYFFGRRSLTSFRRSATLVSAYCVLRIKLTCTLACSVYTVLHADGETTNCSRTPLITKWYLDGPLTNSFMTRWSMDDV